MACIEETLPLLYKYLTGENHENHGKSQFTWDSFNTANPLAQSKQIGAVYLYINNCPTRCNTKQSIYFSASSLYTFRVSTTPIIRSIQNGNYSLRYWSYFLRSYHLKTRHHHVFVILTCLRNSLWKKQSTCHKTDYELNNKFQGVNVNLAWSRMTQSLHWEWREL